MNVEELRSLLSIAPTVRPALPDGGPLLPTDAARCLREIGLPRSIADWFRAVDRVTPVPETKGRVYSVGQERHSLGGAVTLGTSEFGVIVLDCGTGRVVYLDEDGGSQLINNGLRSFLTFEAKFLRASEGGFADVRILRAELTAEDHGPLMDPEGVWSVVLSGSAKRF